MTAEVVVRPVGDPFELTPPPWIRELHVRRPRRVVRQLVGVVGPEAESILGDAELDEPAQPLLTPVLVPTGSVLRRHEVLHLHDLELARPEDEVAGRDLVAERLADLGDAERRLLAGG